jgi:hypothetical protein
MTSRPKGRVEEAKVIERKAADVDWIKTLYDVNLVSDSELTSMYESFRYQGFNRDEMLAELERIAKDPKIAIQLVILCALRGPIAAADVKLMNGLTPRQMGISGSGQMKTKNLSCARISASTADLAAFYMKKLDVPKRILSSPLPGWLQFPTAGSIKLPENIRQQHIEFSRTFSKLIGGEFREEIYSQMMSNAYLDPNLHLF